jgi:chromosome segregation ATPase
VSKLNEQNEKEKENLEKDEITEALSGLGWVEEKDPVDSENRLNEQAKLIEKLNKNILELQKRNQELDALVKSDSKTRDVEISRRDYEQKLSHLQERIDVMKKEKDEFMFKLGDAMREKDEVTRSYEMQVEQLNAQNQALLNRTALNQSFDDEIAIISAEKQEIIRENTHLREENTINHSKIKQLEELSNKLHAEVLTIKAEMQEKTSKFKNLIQELEGYKNEFVNLKSTIVDLEKQNHTLEEELSQKQFQISEESGLTASYKEQIANKEAIIKDLQKEVNGYSEQLQYMEADTVKKSDYEELKRIITNKDQVITTKEKTIFELEKRADELRRHAENTENVIEELKEKLSQKGPADIEVRELKNELQSLNQTIIEQEDQKKVLYEQVRKLREKETGDIAIIQRLEQKIDLMQNSVIKENLELDALKKKRMEIEGELKNIQSKLADKDKLEAKLNRRLNEMKESHEKEVNTLNDEINDLKKRIKILRRDLTKK